MIVNNILGSISYIMIACWLLLFIQSHRMFYIFRKKYPQIAKEEISNAFRPYADPEKILFFFKAKNIPLLKNDKKIWRLRRQTKVLFYLSIGLSLIMVLIAVFYYTTH